MVIVWFLVIISTIVSVSQVNSSVELFLGYRKAPSSKTDSIASDTIGNWPFLGDNPTKGVGTIEGIVNHFGKNGAEGEHHVIISLARILDRLIVISNFWMGV
jgi:hypothetical protein